MSSSLETLYLDYIDCLNRRQWDRLGMFVDSSVAHNGRDLGLAGYRAMLIDDVAAIPDLHFTIDTLVASGSEVAVRLCFDCHPAGLFLGLPINGRHVRFHEHVFYRFEGAKIVEIWSLLDREAIAAQIA